MNVKYEAVMMVPRKVVVYGRTPEAAKLRAYAISGELEKYDIADTGVKCSLLSLKKI